MLKDETVIIGSKNVTKYKPKVLITIRISPKVRIVMGSNSNLTIGFNINSKKANTNEALIMVNSLSGPKLKFPHNSCCKTRANPK